MSMAKGPISLIPGREIKLVPNAAREAKTDCCLGSMFISFAKAEFPSVPSLKKLSIDLEIAFDHIFQRKFTGDKTSGITRQRLLQKWLLNHALELGGKALGITNTRDQSGFFVEKDFGNPSHCRSHQSTA